MLRVLATLRNTVHERVDLLYDGQMDSNGYGYRVRRFGIFQGKGFVEEGPLLKPHEFIALLRAGLENLKIDAKLIDSVMTLTRDNVVR